MTKTTIPEGVVRFTQALIDDSRLRSWFLGLEHLSPSLRSAAFSQISDQMRAKHEDPELMEAVTALIHPAIYDAVLETVRTLSLS